MPTCEFCGESVPPGAKLCPNCGMIVSNHPAPPPKAKGKAKAQPKPKPEPAGKPNRHCPTCGKKYGADYFDLFCTCGGELKLIAAQPAKEQIVPMLLPDEDPPLISPAASTPTKPPPGTPCLVLYGADRAARAWFPLTKDSVVVGRLDPVEGTFPDIDMNEWLTAEEVRKISRIHAYILYSRAKKQFSLRPAIGNTGTQLEADMLDWDRPHPLAPGSRIILGGVARLKFEIV